ncbi:MAG: anhydro-N-acetylmuramic acid kinase [Phycisphaerae bacterium]|nr:anhydro-N-acetylmuramic acid kinase [Phycisphaerae bacterium]
MTGTSLDGIDAAMVALRGDGLDITAEFMAAESRPLADLATDLRRLADQQPMTARRIADLMWELGEAHARVAADLARGSGCLPDLVCIHGQTVYHGGGRTWQLIQPAPIARAIGVPVVYDLRAADIAAGGGGAPVTPIADWVLYRCQDRSRAVVNLGGFCNITIVPPALSPDGLSAVRGFDVCACNHVLDGLARCRAGRAFDEGGRLAAAGDVIPAALDSLGDILDRQSRAGRSLGTGDEISGWISATAAHPAPDVLRTACEAIGRQVARVADADELVLAGGGVRNATLVGAIGRALGEPGPRPTDGEAVRRAIRTSDSLGIPATYREAAAFAVLGALCQDGVPISRPTITNCPSPAPVAGAWVFPPAAAPPSRPSDSIPRGSSGDRT